MTKMSHHDKKQKMDHGFTLTPGKGQEDSLAHELKAIKSAMKELLDHSRSQMTEMKGMKVEMKGMRDEIKNLGCKCDAREKSLQKAQNNDSDGLLEQSVNFSNRVDSQFDEVKNNLKYHEVLMKNQRWKYSAPPPSSDEARDFGTREFFRMIKKQTCDMRYGRSEGEIDIIANVRYNRRLLPHWKEFANALQECQYMLKCLPKDLDTSFGLYGVQLPHEVLDLLSNALESTHFNGFSLMGNNLGRDGIEFALNYVQSNPILKQFGLDGNSIDHNGDATKLCEIIKEHPSIEELQLAGCFGDDMCGHDIVCSIMTAGVNKLKRVYFGENGISTGGSSFISDFLATNPPLETLKLRDNRLDDNDAISIASALNHNTNLQYLDLGGNSIIAPGWEALYKAEFDDKSLTSAADSNHTCVIIGHDYIQHINGDPDTLEPFRRSPLRSKKIYSVLSARNRECSNVQHLEDCDTPIQFLPDILWAIQQYSEYHHEDNSPSRNDNDVEDLSLVFELMRRWDKALSVYESLNISDVH